MTTGISARSTWQPLVSSARLLLAGGRGLSRDYLASAFVFGALVTAMHVFASPVPFKGYYRDALQTVLSDQVGAFSILLAVAFADHSAAGHPQRRTPYVLAVLLGASVWAIVEYSGVTLHGAGFAWYAASRATVDVNVAAQRTVFGIFEWLILGTAATFMYLDARRARHEQDRLRNAELERSRTAKRMLESRLQAMQARVEPQFLFNTMAQVKDLYDTDFAVAERMLDDLIAYLRAAMPRMRDTTSTVAREVELARAYLDIVELCPGNRMQFEIHAPADAAAGRMPPMVLLPLIDHTMRHGSRAARPGAELHISFAVVADRLRMSIADSAGAFYAGTVTEAVASIRERLMALYAGDASLVLSRGEGDLAQVLIEIPFEKAANETERSFAERAAWQQEAT